MTESCQGDSEVSSFRGSFLNSGFSWAAFLFNLFGILVDYVVGFWVVFKLGCEKAALFAVSKR